ncbi:MAG: hypothetical protein GEV10_15215 [Streptosporangiales bacterium]|nr:hypothetical protein [Streptosporangiales bacterium]
MSEHSVSDDEPTVTRLAQLVQQVEHDVAELEGRVAALPRRVWLWWLTLAVLVADGVTLLLPWARFENADLAGVAFGLHTDGTVAFRLLYVVTVVIVAVALTLRDVGATMAWAVTGAGLALAAATGWSWWRVVDSSSAISGVAGPAAGLYAGLALSLVLAGCGALAATRFGFWAARVP